MQHADSAVHHASGLDSSPSRRTSVSAFTDVVRLRLAPELTERSIHRYSARQTQDLRFSCLPKDLVYNGLDSVTSSSTLRAGYIASSGFHWRVFIVQPKLPAFHFHCRDVHCALVHQS